MRDLLLDQLKQITEEEQAILNGQSGVNKSLYTSGRNFRSAVLWTGKQQIIADKRLVLKATGTRTKPMTFFFTGT